MDKPCLRFTKWPCSGGVLHCEIAVRDRRFSVAQEFHAYVDQFLEFANSLVAFPRNVTDETSFSAGEALCEVGPSGWVSLRVFLYDAVGHGAIAVGVDNHLGEPFNRESHFTIRCEVASINRLGRSIAAWLQGEDCEVNVELYPTGA